MIDSTNPRVMADNIKKLSVGQTTQGATLEAEIEALRIYDDEETTTGKIWIDGAPIYRKVVVDTLPNATSKNVNHGITNLGVVVSLKAITQPTAGFDGRPIANAGSQTISIDATYIKLYASSNLSTVPVVVIIEYTKSAPASLNSPAPDDTRSIEPEVREEEPIIDEPIEEPVVEVKKTTRKKTTTNE